ncbi:MAG: FtsX-like permease family protein [Bifidobacteriaceae bacterium]|jgi:putative ABC transport system permease protein|nr:FtsX-like permease family protein [Bifidobacteriaceae bacterium]MCI1978195.1 FtsX-like permease family protein [Bifidobacteriaceae bacterium]
MLSITLKMMRKNLRLLIPAGIAILIGTAFISATFLFSNALNSSLSKNVTAQYGGANYVVAPSSDDGYATLADFDLDSLRNLDAVKGVREDSSTQASLVKGSDSSVSLVLPMSSQEGDAALMPVRLAKGAWPQKSGEIAVTQETANRLSVGVGDRIKLTATTYDGSKENTAQEKVVGFTVDPDNAYSYYAGASVLPEADFYSLLNLTHHMDQKYVASVYLLLDTDGKTQAETEAILSQIKQKIPKDFEIQSRAEAATKAIESVGQGQNVMTTFLLIFGIIALLVAALVIANTFQVLVAQRRRTLALLRTIGARKGQLYRSVLVEAGVLGLIASALGVVVAIALMWVMSLFHVGSATAGSSQMTLAGTGGGLELVIDWRVVVLPLVFGILMTMVASLSSARMATSVTPLEALRPLETMQNKKAGVVRALLSMVGIFGGGALATFAVLGVMHMSEDSTDFASFNLYLLMAIGGAAILFLGLILSAVWWMPWLMRGAGSVISHTGPSAKIAAANVQKNPRRVAATGVALLIGVTLVTTISTGAASAKQTLVDTMAGKYAVDVQISGDSLNEGALKAVEKVKGVKSASLLDSVVTSVSPKDAKTVSGSKKDSTDDISVGMVGISEQQRKDLIRADVSTESTADTVVMNETLLTGEKNPYKDGDKVTFAFQDAQGKKRSVALTAVLKDFNSMTTGQITALVDPSVLQGAAGSSGTDKTSEAADATGTGTSEAATGTAGSARSGHPLIWVQVNDDAAAVQLISDIQTILKRYPEVSVTGPFAEREMWETSINTVLMILVGLLAVSVIIALIGVANTLSLSVIERTRESATLRAIGMTKKQLRTSLGVEALIISLVSGIAGVLLGIAFGWLGSTVVLWSMGTVSLRIDWVMCSVILVIAIAAALVSSIIPARRAVKTPPVVALAEA